MRRNVNQNERKGRIREIAGKAGKFAATAVLVTGLAVAGCAGKKDEVKTAKDTTAQEMGYSEMKKGIKKKKAPEPKAVDEKEGGCGLTLEEYSEISNECELDTECIANELMKITPCEEGDGMEKEPKKKNVKEALLFR